MNLRDGIRRYAPWFLNESIPEAFNAGFRVMWAAGRLADLLIEVVLQGSLAAVGRGTPTAIGIIGEARGIVRGEDESDEAYALRLRGWIERAKHLGSAYGIAREVHEFLPERPRVRVINSKGVWGTLDHDGSWSVEDATWDWDSISHPERVDPARTDLYVVVYVDRWPDAPLIGDGVIGTPYGVGHLVSRRSSQDLRRTLFAAAPPNSRIRSVIWCRDPNLFDPSEPATCPDGTWGAWGRYDANGNYVRSGRASVAATCRFWEF